LAGAACAGHTRILSALLSAGADPDGADFENWTGVYAAAGNGHIDAVNIFLDAGAQPDVSREKGWTPLAVAALKGHTRIVRRLLQANANYNHVNPLDGRSVLFMAARGGSSPVVDLLLNVGASPNTPDSENSTPFFEATLLRHVQIMTQLIDAGADINIRGHLKRGMSCLCQASFAGHLDAVEVLINAGADASPSYSSSTGT
jgi:ankyrin repeat protein